MGLGIYKRGQGFYTRICSAFAFAIIAGLGCRRLYQVLQATDLGLWVKTMVPAGLFVALSLLIFWLVNTPSLANFMIAAEGEMKKVSWSSRKEIAVSTFVVIMVVIIMAVLLGATDMTFQLIFKWLLD
jgi:preprotein translocase subunit SecE